LHSIIRIASDEGEDELTGTWASTVAANGWAGLPTPRPSGSRGTKAAGGGILMVDCPLNDKVDGVIFVSHCMGEELSIS
jgi:hypothetical protein